MLPSQMSIQRNQRMQRLRVRGRSADRIRSPKALGRAPYAKALHALVRWIDICDGNMQEGSFRCDANVSVRRPGAPPHAAEIKNLNSFRFLERAIEFEAKRQIEISKTAEKSYRRRGFTIRTRIDALDAYQGGSTRFIATSRPGLTSP